MKFTSLAELQAGVATLWDKVMGKEKPSGAAAADPPTLESLGAAVETIEGNVAKLEGVWVAAKKTLETKVTTLETELSIAKEDLATARAGLKTEAEKGKAWSDQVAQLEATIADPKGEIAKQVRALAAAQGIAVDQLPAGAAGGDSNSKRAAIEKEYERLVASGDTHAAGKYYQEHRDILWG